MATLVPLPVRSRSRKVRTATRSWMMLPFYTEDCGLPKLAVPSDDATVQAAIPEGYALEQNHPNPFNPNTTITFAVPEASEVKLAIYNMTGQLVRTLHSGVIAAGQHSVVWDGTDFRKAKVASRAYVYRLEAKGFVISRKLTQMK